MHTLEYHHANSSILKRTTSINFIAFLNFFLHFKHHENDQMWPRLSQEVQAVDIDIIQQSSGPWRNISSLPSSKVFSKNDEAEISSGPISEISFHCHSRYMYLVICIPTISLSHLLKSLSVTLNTFSKDRAVCQRLALGYFQ